MFAVYILLFAERKRRRRQIWSLIFDLFRGVSLPIPCQFRLGVVNLFGLLSVYFLGVGSTFSANNSTNILNLQNLGEKHLQNINSIC